METQLTLPPQQRINLAGTNNRPSHVGWICCYRSAPETTALPSLLSQFESGRGYTLFHLQNHPNISTLHNCVNAHPRMMYGP